MLDFQRLRNDLLALGCLALVVFLALSLISYDPADPPASMVYPARDIVANWGGQPGALAANSLYAGLGEAAWALIAVLLIFDWRLFSRAETPDPGMRMVGGALLVTACALTLQLLIPAWGHGPVIGSGGWVGAWSVALIERHLTMTGGLIIAATLAGTGVLLLADQGVSRGLLSGLLLPLRLLMWPLRPWMKRPPECEPLPLESEFKNEVEDETWMDAAPPVARPIPVHAPPDVSLPPRSIERPVASSVPATPSSFKVNLPLGGRTKPVKAAVATIDQPRPVHRLPDASLLENGQEFPFEKLAAKAQQNAALLEKTFEQFGLKVKVTEIDTGPVVTLFEIDLEPGLKVAKVISLQDDLAIALRVPAVRVVSPIPGKNTVGVEVPNDIRVMVRMKELIEAAGPELDKLRIPMFLGKDVSGQSLVVDMAKMPHLLIAGRTGTGKSVCLNTLIVSMLMTRTPDEVRMLMIDPKMVELSPFTKLPHLMHPVITDMKKAEAVLAWAVDKMEERYDLLARVGVRHLDIYNKLDRDEILDRLEIDPDSYEAEQVPDKMPYIVIIADEMADMIMTSGKDVEAHIIRLAQKSRAVGIHLVLATQKPTVDVITGLIKSNLPARIAFQVASKNDSRVVLDENGAEKLLGYGDMLFLAPGTSNLRRAQGTYISDEEVNAVIDFFRDQPTQYSAEIAEATAAALRKDQKDSGGDDSPRQRDDMYSRAVEVVIQEGRGSVSLLQRALGIGYGRAARMVDWMAEDGIVGDYNGAKSRDVVMTMDQWYAKQSGFEDEEEFD
ncbi:MAG: DNA translocase FtsK [Planctomycetota bacterium]|nr:MAG: DNA translocase FtsK [Planctomycetota bacterium]